MGSIHAMERYSAIKRNEGLTPATPWKNLENITLSERGPVTTRQALTVCFHAVSRRGTFPETETSGGPRGGEEWARGATA